MSEGFRRLLKVAEYFRASFEGVFDRIEIKLSSFSNLVNLIVNMTSLIQRLCSEQISVFINHVFAARELLVIN